MKRGFTLIEILIVVAITALLSGFILTYTSTGRDQVILSIEEAKVAQTVLRAKSLSIATYGVAGASVPCGYGVHFYFDEQAFSLFRYDAPDCNTIQAIDPAYMSVLSSSTLSTSVKFIDSADKLGDILFIPPNPDTLLWQPDVAATTTSGEIDISTRKGDSIRVVNINSAGQISF